MPQLKNMNFICIDCEMTGLDLEKDRIIEVAACRFTLSETLAQFETLVFPDCPISEESMAIHRINPEMLVGKPKIDAILPELFQFIGNTLIIGHGVGFDIDFIDSAAKRAGIPCTLKLRPFIDTLRLARLYGDSPNNSLESLASHFNIPSAGAHRAMNDVEMNIEVFKYLIKRYHTTEEIFQILSKPIKMKFMPLGKHKGRPFSEIPLQYLQRAAQMDFDQDLSFSIRSEIKRRKQGGLFSLSSNPFSNL